MVDSPGRGPLNILAFATACVVGGSTTGVALAVLGGLAPVSPPPGPAVAGVIVLACVALLRDLGVVRFWMPENRRQVRQTVLRHRPLVGDAMFGFELGTGARTYLPATAPYLVALAVIILGEGTGPGLATGAAFGLSRGLVVADRALHKDRDRWDKALQHYRRLLPVIGLAVSAALLLILATGSAGQPTATTTTVVPAEPAAVSSAVSPSTTVLPQAATATTEGMSTTTTVVAPVVTTNSLPPLTVHRLPVFRRNPAPDPDPEGGPTVIPLAWSGEPINVKVIAVRDGSLGFAVVDFTEGIMTVYWTRDHHLPGSRVDGLSLTAEGDVVVVSHDDVPEVYLVPDADFSKPPIRLHPSRISSSWNAPIPNVLADRNGSLVWMLQYDHQETEDGEKTIEICADLVNIDTGETVMSTTLEGHYSMVGVLDDGLLLGRIDEIPEDSNEGLLVIDRDGTVREVAKGIYEPTENWPPAAWVAAAHGKHIALISYYNQELVVVDIETNHVQPIPKPGPGVWTGVGIPYIPTHSETMTRADEFVIGFRPTAGNWSLQAVSLADQSVRQLGEYEGRRPQAPNTYKPLFRAVSMADGDLVLAIRGSQIDVVDDAGNLVPVVRLPNGYYVLDAA